MQLQGGELWELTASREGCGPILEGKAVVLEVTVLEVEVLQLRAPGVATSLCAKREERMGATDMAYVDPWLGLRWVLTFA